MPVKVKIYNQTGEAVGERELSEKVFGVKPEEKLIHQVAVAALANRRSVLADTKTKAEVRGGGRKPWRQKGTGRARAGSIRSPLWIGGGVVFGPKSERNFKQKINQKMNRKAMFMVLSDRVASGAMLVVDRIKMDAFKTKEFEQRLKKMEVNFNIAEKPAKKSLKPKRNVLIVAEKPEVETKNSARNLSGVKFIGLGNINLLDLLNHRNLILTAGTVDELEKRAK